MPEECIYGNEYDYVQKIFSTDNYVLDLVGLKN